MSGRPPGSGGQPKTLTMSDIKKINQTLVGTRYEHRNRALFFTGLGTGMRIHELCNLLIEDVYPDKHNVADVIQLGRSRTKTKKPRNVAVSAEAQRYLKTWLRMLPPKQLKPKSPVFPSQRFKSRCLSTSQAQDILRDIFHAAGVYGASSHSMRRTHANELRRRGADIKVIQQQLGHEHLVSTGRYFSLDPIEITAVVNQLKFS